MVYSLAFVSFAPAVRSRAVETRTESLIGSAYLAKADA